MAAADDNKGKRLAVRGLASVTPEEGVKTLELMLGSELAHVGILPLDVQRWREFYPAAADTPILSRLVEATTPPPEGQDGPAQRLSSLSSAGRRQVVQDQVRTVIGRVTRRAPQDLPHSTPLGELGIDSLMGLEIRNQLERSLGVRMPASFVWFHPTVEALVDQICAMVDGDADESAAGESAVESAPRVGETLAENLNDLGEDQLAELLRAELDTSRAKTS